MNRLKRRFNAARPTFTAGGGLRRLGPLFEAMERFAFWPATPTGGAPHVRDPLDVKRFMTMVIIALLPCVFASVGLFGWRSLAMIAVSYAAGGAVEVLFACVRKQEINEGFLVTGLLFPLILPPSLPLWMVAVGVAFGVTVGKEIFGGTGRNLFNPALVGRCFLFLAYPSAVAGRWVDPAANDGLLDGFTQWLNVDAITAATPLGDALNGQYASLSNLLIGNAPGSLGATSSLAILIGGVFLLLTRVANYRTTVGMLAGFAATGAVLNLAGAGFEPPAFGMLAGGLLFGAFFMATDPVTAPSTNPARWMYGVLIGGLTVLMRRFTPLPEGVMFAILLGNIFAPIADEIVIAVRIRRIARER